MENLAVSNPEKARGRRNYQNLDLVNVQRAALHVAFC